MRNPVTLVVGFVVALLVGVLGVVLIDAIPRTPGWLDTVWWVVVALAFILWAFGDSLRRAP